MRLLIDTCVWRGALDALREAGHDVQWVGDWERDPGDEALLEYARTHGRAIVTLDKDFGDLIVRRGVGQVGMIRLVQIPARLQGRHCCEAVEKYGSEIEAGAIVTVEPGRVRIRQTESGD